MVTHPSRVNSMLSKTKLTNIVCRTDKGPLLYTARCVLIGEGPATSACTKPRYGNHIEKTTADRAAPDTLSYTQPSAEEDASSSLAKNA